MKKMFVLAAMTIVLAACEGTVGDASLIEGGWELKTIDYDKTISYDQMGSSHMKDEPFTHTYEEKKMVWLFYKGYIGWFAEYTDSDGNVDWSGYAGDATKTYVVEGEGANMTIVETTRSMIPGENGSFSIVRYHVEKLTKREMVLFLITPMYISDLGTTVDVQQTYTFKRENTLLEYVKQEWR